LDKYDRRAFERERDIEREYRLSDYADGNDREKLFFYNGFFVGKQQAGLGFELEKGVDYEDILADDGLNRQGANGAGMISQIGPFLHARLLRLRARSIFWSFIVSVLVILVVNFAISR
ncbi:MAG: hypothetical protein EZS28_049427, partial [Streblomastix strix]